MQVRLHNLYLGIFICRGDILLNDHGDLRFSTLIMSGGVQVSLDFDEESDGSDSGSEHKVYQLYITIR